VIIEIPRWVSRFEGQLVGSGGGESDGDESAALPEQSENDSHPPGPMTQGSLF